MTSSHVEENGLHGARRHRALITVTLGLTLAVMDSAITNAALPSIAIELQAAASASVWIVNAYQIALIIALLPLGAMGELLGYRQVYLAGLALLAVASLASALAGSLFALAIARVIQGIAAAGILSVNLALVRYIVPREQLGAAIGLNTTVAAIALTLGPSLSCVVLSCTSWPWLFAISVPGAIAALLLGYHALPNSHRRSDPFDWRSAVLNALTFGLALLTIALFAHQQHPIIVIGALLTSLLAGWLLMRRQLVVPAPMMPLDLLRLPAFSLSLTTSICAYTTQMLAFVSLPFYFQAVLGFDVANVGLLLAPWPLALACIARTTGKLADRYDVAILGAAGMTVLAAGLLLFALLPPAPTLTGIVLCMTLCGIGFGVFQPANMRTSISSAPAARSGAAAGMMATARLLGQSIGAALVAYILNRYGTEHVIVALYVAAAFAAASGMVSLVLLRIR